MRLARVKGPMDPPTHRHGPSVVEQRCRDFVEQAWRQGDPDAVARHLAADARIHRFGMPDDEPIAAYAAYIAAVHHAFPDLEIDVMEVIAGPDGAACRYRVRGTHQGEFISIPPTGRRIDFMGLCMMRFRDDVVVEEWAGDDAIAIFNQIGVLGIDAQL